MGIRHRTNSRLEFDLLPASSSCDTNHQRNRMVSYERSNWIVLGTAGRRSLLAHGGTMDRPKWGTPRVGS